MKELEEAYVSPGLVTPPAVNVDTGPVLLELRTRGYKIGLICNTGRVQDESCVNCLPAPEFSAISTQPSSRMKLDTGNLKEEDSSQQPKNWDFQSTKSSTLATTPKQMSAEPNKQA